MNCVSRRRSTGCCTVRSISVSWGWTETRVVWRPLCCRCCRTITARPQSFLWRTSACSTRRCWSWTVSGSCSTGAVSGSSANKPNNSWRRCWPRPVNHKYYWYINHHIHLYFYCCSVKDKKTIMNRITINIKYPIFYFTVYYYIQFVIYFLYISYILLLSLNTQLLFHIIVLVYSLMMMIMIIWSLVVVVNLNIFILQYIIIVY